MSAYSAAVLADSPFSYYRLSETTGTTIVDSSGNGHGATASASLPPGGATSLLSGEPSNGAITFDSTAALGPPTAQAAVGYDGPPVSVEFWIKPVDLTNPTDGKSTVVSNSTGGVGWLVFYDSTTGVWTWGNRGVADAAFTAAAVAGTTQHIVMTTPDTVTIKLYVNGALSQTVGPFGAATPTGAPVTQISGESYGTRRIRATVDEVAIYSSVLSAARISAHFAAASASSSHNLGLLGVGT